MACEEIGIEHEGIILKESKNITTNYLINKV